MKTKILLAGGSGLIGQQLVQYLDPDKFEFNILSRSRRQSGKNYNYYLWDTSKKTIDADALDGVAVIINLAGAGIADKKWTASRKEELVNSRVFSALTIKEHLDQFEDAPLYIGASATGYYGDQGDRKLTESDKLGSGFLADVTKDWENAHLELKEKVRRHVMLRIGIVLSKNGGALKEILKPAMAGVYGYFGNGSAYYPWIHIDDVCEIIRQTISNEKVEGPINTTAPAPVTIKTLVKSVKEAKSGFGFVLPVPNLALQLMMGEMKEMLTKSTRVIPQRLQDMKHNFLYPNLVEAIKDILEKKV